MDHETKFYETRQEKAEVELEIAKARLEIVRNEVKQTEHREQIDKATLLIQKLEFNKLKNNEPNLKDQQNIKHLDSLKIELEAINTEIQLKEKRRELKSQL